MLKCEQKNLIDGEYQPKKANYFLHDKITPHCKPGYYLWGPPSLTCWEYDADVADWYYPGCEKGVHTELFNCNETPEPECVTSTEFDKKCENVGGHATLTPKKGRDSMICEKSPEEPGKLHFFCVVHLRTTYGSALLVTRQGLSQLRSTNSYYNIGKETAWWKRSCN